MEYIYTLALDLGVLTVKSITVGPFQGGGTIDKSWEIYEDQ